MLTDIKARAAKPAEKVYRLYDGGGMYLEVPPSGNKRWRLKYRVNGKEKRLSLGVYPNVGLKEAREKRDELRRLIAEGIDPAAQRCPQKVAPTADSFEMVAREWMDLRSPAWAPRHLSTTCQRLEAYIFPHIGPLPIDQIGPLDVLNALRIVEKRGAVEAARKTLSICSQVFRYAVASARIQSDPCRDLRGGIENAPARSLCSHRRPEGCRRPDASDRRVFGGNGCALRPSLPRTDLRSSRRAQGCRMERVRHGAPHLDNPRPQNEEAARAHCAAIDTGSRRSARCARDSTSAE